MSGKNIDEWIWLLRNFPHTSSKLLISGMIGDIFEWDKWRREIPALSFPADWLIRITPPESGAVIRFRVALKKYPEKWSSIYLDCYDVIGFFGEPYWEVYPIEDDIERCHMNDTDRLIELIRTRIEKAVRNGIVKALKINRKRLMRDK